MSVHADSRMRTGTSLVCVALLLLAGCRGPSGAAPQPQAALPAPPPTESAVAYAELLATLEEVQREFLSTGNPRVAGPSDAADGHRYLLHLLEQALLLQLESSPQHPRFEHQGSPIRKVNGDNPDAIYWTAAIDGSKTYRVRGNQAGAVYSSLTVDAGAQRDGYAGRIAGVINDTQYDIADDGSFEVLLGGPPRPRNWLALPPDATRVGTRHYFEEATSVASDPDVYVPMSIEVLDPGPPPPTPDDASIAASIRRVARYVRSRTLDMPMPDPMPRWVSQVPNQFPRPEKPGKLAYAAADAAYTMAPFSIGPDEALVITGRFPVCRMANVVLWNAWRQSFDYANRQISLNRAQTTLEPDGRFRIVVSHRDPGVPNWLDTEGRTSGLIYWRFMLPEGEIETPIATVVPFEEVAAR